MTPADPIAHGSTQRSAIIKAFPTPVARVPYPHASSFNEQIADAVLIRLHGVDIPVLKSLLLCHILESLCKSKLEEM